jgi:RHS repeat-associated protein
MNGDGLPDYVYFSPDLSRHVVYFNTRTGFTADAAWTGADDLDAIAAGQHTFYQTSDLIDVNGDGLTDFVQAAPDNVSTFLQVRTGAGVRGNLLTGIDNGLGASYAATYVASTDPATAGAGCPTGDPCMSSSECQPSTCTVPCTNCSRLPFATWVVRNLTEHTEHPGLHPTDSGFATDAVTQYTFTGPYFDAPSHQFRGFRQSVETRLGDLRSIRRQFAAPPFATSTSPPWPDPVPSRPFKLIDMQVLDQNGAVLTRSTTDWNALSLGAGRFQIHPNQQIDTTYSTAGSTKKVRTRTFVFDTLNNLTQETVSGQTMASSGTTNDFDPITTTTTYANSLICPGNPTKVVVTSANFDYSERDFTYDPAHCDLTSFGARLAAPGQSATSANLPLLTTTLVYGATGDGRAGMPTTIIDPRGNATTLYYDCTNGLYPCTIINALQQATLKTYDVQWGKPMTVTDPNGALTVFGYDGLGRLALITRDLDNCLIGSCPWREFAYAFGAAASGTTATIASRGDTLLREPNTSSGYRTVSTFYDGMGRTLETKREDSVNGSSAVVVTDGVSFDAVGRVATRHSPFIAAAAVTAYEVPPTGETSYQYDVLDRVVTTSNPDQTSRTADFSMAGRVYTRDENATAYDAGQTINVSGAGRRTEQFFDALGRLTDTRVYDGGLNVNGLRERTVRTYDPLNRVASITPFTDLLDHEFEYTGTTVSFFYDSLGRRSRMHDPDSYDTSDPNASDWTYAYDPSGNLVYQDDPKHNQHLEFCYDELNRVRCKYGYTTDAASGSTSCPTSATAACPARTGATVLAQYTYDGYGSTVTPNFTCGSSTGRLCRVDDTSGWTSFSYDSRGRLLGSEKTITANGITKTFPFQFGYDVADRQVAMNYPNDAAAPSDTETLTYQYDFGGHLVGSYTAGQTYLGLARYDRFGRVTSHYYGSPAIVTTWTYFDDAAGPPNQFRLQQIDVSDGTNTYQRFSYASVAYDRAGNLLAVNDDNTAPGYPYADGADRDNDWTYQYDGLGRVTKMTPHAGVWGAAGTFSYDGRGNITQRADLTLTPAVQSHQIVSSVPSAAPPAYAYDPNGGLTARPDTDGSGPDAARTITYDPDGRVHTVTAGNTVVQSLYDFSGARVVRLVTVGTAAPALTMYFGRAFEITGTELTRHMYAGDRRIADSPINLSSTSPWTLARLDPGEQAIQLARAMSDTLQRTPRLYPEFRMSARVAVVAGMGAVLLCLGLAVAPGRVRVAYLGKVGRGRVAIFLVIFALADTPLPLVRPAWATCGSNCGPPPAPVYAVYFVHTDHLGSTTLLTCSKQPSSANCPDRTPAMYFRYDAYGAMKAWDKTGAAVLPGTELTDLLYTGQRWEWWNRTYYYGARFYDPRVANWLTEEPLFGNRHDTTQGLLPLLASIDASLTNPYIYGLWNPVRSADFDGRIVPAVAVTAAILVALGGVAGGFASQATGGSFGAGFVAGASGALVGIGLGALGTSLVAASTVGSAAGGALGTASSMNSQGGSLLTNQAVTAIAVNTAIEAFAGFVAGIAAEASGFAFGLSELQSGSVGAAVNAMLDVSLGPATSSISTFGASSTFATGLPIAGSSGFSFTLSGISVAGDFGAGFDLGFGIGPFGVGGVGPLGDGSGGVSGAPSSGGDSGSAISQPAAPSGPIEGGWASVILTASGTLP